jgi:fatty acid desaturase
VLARAVLNFFGIVDAYHAMKDMVLNTFGILDAEQKTYIPEMEQPRVFTVARVWFAIYAATIATAISMGSILPLMLIGLPRLYGAWHHVLCGLIQHGGLAENVLDHRLNSRTVYMNPISRFIYWNMNYHVEHHMFPMVPYHALPRLHELIKHDLPPANDGFIDAYREMVPALIRQLRYEDWFIKKELPPTAKPYRPQFHGDLEPVMIAAE